MQAEADFPTARRLEVELTTGPVSTAVYEVAGPPGARPVVLLHGLGAWSYTWRSLLPELTTRRRAVAVDLLGHGSTGAARRADCSPRGLLRHVMATLEALEIERAVWAGNSLGGGLGLLAAMEEPWPVGGLVLLAPAGYPQRMPRNLAVLRWPGAPWLCQFLPPGLIVREMLSRVLYDSALMEPETIARYTAPLADRRRRRALMRAGASIWPEDLEAIAARIPTIEAPTLVLWGEEDRITPAELARRYLREMPRCRLVLLPGTGHAPQEERPEEVAAEVLAFLETLEE